MRTIKIMNIAHNSLNNLEKPDIFASFIKNSPGLKIAYDSFQVNKQSENNEIKKEKGHKGLNIKILGGTSILLISILASAAFMHSRVGWFAQKSRIWYKNLETSINKLKNNKEILSPLERLSLCVKEKIQQGLDFLLSFNQLKDHALGKALGPLKRGVDKIVSYFKKAAIKTTGEKYDSLAIYANNMHKSLSNLVQTMRKNGLDDEAQAIEKILEKGNIKAIIKNDLKAGYQGRVVKLQENLNEIVNSYDDLVMGNIPKSTRVNEILRDIPGSIKEIGSIYKRLKEDLIANTGKRLLKPKEEALNALESLGNTLAKIQKSNPEFTRINKASINKISKDIDKLSGNIKKATNFEVDNLTTRLFDLDLDGGILEVITPVMATGVLANEVRKAETSEDKKKKAIRLGIPILGGIGAWYYSAVIKCMSAGAGLAFGFACGLGFDRLGRYISSAIYGEKEE